MSEQHATLEIRINKKDDKGFPVEMSLKPPDDEYRHFPVGHLSADILKLRTRGYSPEDGGRMFDLLFNDGQLRENWL